MVASPLKYRFALLLVLTLALVSCGGGATYTAGVGGSGIGGTGITTVTGNVSQVVARAAWPDSPAIDSGLLAEAARLLAEPASAQSASLAGIRVFGGGRETTTDSSGAFRLDDVVPSDNFVLTFVLPDEGPVKLGIGKVVRGSRVQVDDVVIHASQHSARAGSVKVQEHGPGNQSGNGHNGSGNNSNNGNSGMQDNPAVNAPGQQNGQGQGNGVNGGLQGNGKSGGNS